jgi:shikimate kinase
MQNSTLELAINKPVFLVGMPCCGKSSIGRSLAKLFGLEFEDTDKSIAKAHNQSVQELFNLHGEKHFRVLEKELCEGILIIKKIISTGGGFPIYHNNMDKMLEKGIVVFIETPLPIVAKRVLVAKTPRPMFSGLTQAEIGQKLIEVYQARVSIYQQAHIHYKTDIKEGVSQNALSLALLIQNYIKYAEA